MTRFTTHYMTHSKLVFGQECINTMMGTTKFL